MPKKRRLTDLYVIGTDLTFEDPDGEPITVFIRKLNPVDHETALRNANAARSRAASMNADHESVDYQALRSGILQYTKNDLIDYLASDLEQERTAVIEARVAGNDEWTDDNYLQGLQDAWDGGMSERYVLEPDDAEARQVKAELQRFADAVSGELADEVNELKQELDERPIEVLQEKVLAKIAEIRVSIAWLEEFRKCQVWLSVRDTDKRTKYFQDRHEVDELEETVYLRLQTAYQQLTIDPIEGKDSAATLPSSPSSAPPDEPVTDESSGLTGAAA